MTLLQHCESHVKDPPINWRDPQVSGNTLASIVWLVSTMCMDGTCVKVGRLPDGNVAVGDTKRPDLAPHAFTPKEWESFVAGVKAGEFDLASLPQP